MTEKYNCFNIGSDEGISARLCEYGARLLSLKVPDKNGRQVDVTLGFDTSEEYENDHGTYFGATIGRVANRIGGGVFELDGKEYALAKNDNGVHHLHGGNAGFDKRVWTGEQISENCVRFRYVSEDGEEGYPGRLRICVEYAILGNRLQIKYVGRAWKKTLCSLTNHTYFNLDGDGKSVLEHMIYIDADSLTAVDGGLIPTGERLDLTKRENAAYSFLIERRLGEYLGMGGELMRIANGGYDFSYNFAGGADGNRPRATAYSQKTGIKMSVFTDLPAMQFYTGNFLDGFRGKAGHQYKKHAAFCMETQIDIADKSQKVLEADEIYHTVTAYEFETV